MWIDSRRLKALILSLVAAFSLAALCSCELFFGKKIDGVTTVSVTGVSLSPSSATIALAATRQLSVSVSPSAATNQAVSFSTSDANVATVSSAGLVTAVGYGNATVTVTTSDGGKQASCAITVTIPITSVNVSPSSSALSVGATQQLTVSIRPANATNQAVTFSSSDSRIASVSSSGLVTAIAPGTAFVTVRASDGGYSAICTITVKSSPTDPSTAPILTDVTAGGSFTLTGLEGQSVYLVKLNGSSSALDSSATGAVSSLASLGAVESLSGDDGFASDGAEISGVFSGNTGRVVREEHEGARLSLGTPPSLSDASSSARSVAGSEPLALAVPASVGDTRSFWVDDANNVFQKITATLRGTGTHANVWVANANDAAAGASGIDTIDAATAQSIAETFDKIYPAETAVFGYEYGGNPSLTDSYGGRDGETRVNILIYDVDFDTSTVSSTHAGIVGYFWAKDYNLTYLYSNESEIFYIDSWFTKNELGVTYSTLVHEFQHMIGYNEKTIRQGKSLNSSWYTEMLSQVAEDMLSPYLETWLGDGYDTDADGPIQSRFPRFNYRGYSLSGVTDWLGGSDVYDSYASSFAFGAYLARNYGGAALIKEIAGNPYVDAESVSDALATLGRSETTFDAAFARYGEALVFSSSGFSDYAVPQAVNSFDRASSSAIGSYTYSFAPFDVWKINKVSSTGAILTTGPKAYGLADDTPLRPYGISLQTDSSWQNITGNLTVSVTAPTDANVRMFLMVRRGS